MHRQLWFLLGAALCLTAQAQPSSPVFEETDVFELEIAADPQISPDGAAVAYARLSMDIMTDRPRSNVWIVSADGTNHRPLLSGPDDYSSPRWSPSGDRIAYVASAEGHGPQLYVRWLDTGQTAMLTNLREVPTAIAWSPDGTQLAFAMFVASEAPQLATPPEKPEGASWAAPVKVVDRLIYRFDGAGYLKSGFTHIFVVPAQGGTPRQLTTGDFDHGPTPQAFFNGALSWSPDGTYIVFAANRNADHEYQSSESEIWRVEVASGALMQLTDRVGPDFAPSYSPDGRTIAYLGYDERRMGYDNVRVYLMASDGSDVRVLTEPLDRSVGDVQWAGSSNRLYATYEDRGRIVLASLSTRGDIEPITDDLGGVFISRPYTSASFSTAANGAYAYTAGTPYRPSDAAVGRRNAAPRKLTALNEDLLGTKRLGTVEELTWTSSADGREIQGWIVKPPAFDSTRRYPLMLEIHGGPFAAYGPTFAAELQLYAAAGYVVLYANPRGSTSYGDAFANEIHHNYPGEDYDDLMSGVDAVIAQGFVDESRLFVTGGSGGGVLTAWIVGKTHRFRAAAVVKPVINWAAEALTSDLVGFMNDYWFANAPWEDPDEYWRRSPLSLVGNVTTPTLLMTGEQDHRTPISESEQFYSALKLRKIDTVLVRVPDASHDIAARPSQLIAKVASILAWFARYDDEP